MQGKDPISRVRIRVAAAFYMIFALLLGLVQCIWIFACFKGWRIHWDLIAPGLIPLTIFAGIFFWLRGIEIRIEGNSIYYSTLFRRRGLSLEEIATARTEWGWSAGDKRNRPFYRLVIEPYADTGKDPIEINLIPFSRRSFQPVFEFLRPKMPEKKKKSGHE